MNIEHAMITGLSASSAVLGWLARELWSAVQKLRSDLSALEVRISNDYVRYDRLQDALEPIKQTLDEIKSVLTHKADKL